MIELHFLNLICFQQTYDVIFQVGIALLKEGKDKLINMDIEGMLQVN